MERLIVKNNLALICWERCQKLPLLNLKINGNPGPGSVCLLQFNTFCLQTQPHNKDRTCIHNLITRIEPAYTSSLPAVFASDQISLQTNVWISWTSPWSSSVFLVGFYRNLDTSLCSRPSRPSLSGHSSCRGAGLTCPPGSPPSAACWRWPRCSRRTSCHHRHPCSLSFCTGFAFHIPWLSGPRELWSLRYNYNYISTALQLKHHVVNTLRLRLRVQARDALSYRGWQEGQIPINLDLLHTLPHCFGSDAINFYYKQLMKKQKFFYINNVIFRSTLHL